MGTKISVNAALSFSIPQKFWLKSLPSCSNMRLLVALVILARSHTWAEVTAKSSFGVLRGQVAAAFDGAECEEFLGALKTVITVGAIISVYLSWF